MTRKPSADISVPAELVAALRRAAAQLPAHPHDLTLPYRRHRRRRRSLLVGSAAIVCAVAAAVGGPVLLLKPQPHPVAQPDPVSAPSTTVVQPAAAVTVDPHAADRPDFYFTVAAGPVAGYEVRPSSVGPDYQVAAITTAAGDRVASLVLYRPGGTVYVVPDGPVEPGAEPNAQVNGAPAFVAASGAWSSVQWHYSPDALAVIRTADGAGPLPEPTLVALAEGVVFVDPYAVRVPFRLDYVPADLPLFHVSSGSVQSASVQFLSDSDGNARGMDIMVSDDPTAFRQLNPAYQVWDWRPATIGGRVGRCVDLVDGTRCEVSFGEVIVSIGSGQLTAAELDRLVDGLHLASLDDPATWYDIDDAIPSG